jgi:hypothetical protein
MYCSLLSFNPFLRIACYISLISQLFFEKAASGCLPLLDRVLCLFEKICQPKGEGLLHSAAFERVCHIQNIVVLSGKNLLIYLNNKSRVKQIIYSWLPSLNLDLHPTTQLQAYSHVMSLSL